MDNHPVMDRIVRQGGKILMIILIATLTAGDGSPQAETIHDVLCRHVCPPLDAGLEKAERYIRFGWARWKGRTRWMTPPRLPGQNEACGVLPGEEAIARCCVETGAHLVIEYSGKNPYTYPETLWRVVCKTE
jgi:hypothetical protein